jgi:uncharacterized membrane protein/thiol-disulfide isomerase/thioredoxin
MKKLTRQCLFLLVAVLLASAALTKLALAAAGQESTPRPTATIKACHMCDDDLILGAEAQATPAGPAQTAPDIVRAILFWMESCPLCHSILEEVLPPLQGKYGNLLEIRLIEVATSGDFDQLIQTAASFGIPKEQVGVPFLVIGENALVGSEQIPAELPGLIERYLAEGGVDYPELPALSNLPIPGEQGETSRPAATSEGLDTPGLPVVHILLFWTSDCHACRTVVSEALPPLKERYAGQFMVKYVDVVTGDDVAQFYQVAAAFGISKEQAEIPMLIVGDRVLIGAEQIPAELPGLVELYLAVGGVELPDITRLVEAASSPDPVLPDRPDGFNLALGVMAFMIAALLISTAAILRGRSLPLTLRPSWLDALFILLALVGLGVALYLAYVETQAVTAVCGPVGDCNAVQSGPYARLFGVLPIGVLGAAGYLLILAAWILKRFRDGQLAGYASLAIFGMTFFGTLFSLYLTYLEPFVIKAVCAWCLTSAMLITLLLLINISPSLLKTARSVEN